ncbi:hypothetical protein C8Q72DRAFT_810943, partial [Fomitopsis betulina]
MVDEEACVRAHTTRPSGADWPTRKRSAGHSAGLRARSFRSSRLRSPLDGLPGSDTFAPDLIRSLPICGHRRRWPCDAREGGGGLMPGARHPLQNPLDKGCTKNNSASRLCGAGSGHTDPAARPAIRTCADRVRRLRLALRHLRVCLTELEGTLEDDGLASYVAHLCLRSITPVRKASSPLLIGAAVVVSLSLAAAARYVASH